MKHLYKFIALVFIFILSLPAREVNLFPKKLNNLFAGVEVQYIGNSKGRKENPTVVR